MQLSDIPAKFNIPFASSAIAPYIRTVPQSPSGTPGQAALTTGFPPENFNPVAAGGVPPFGADFNGLLNQSTAWNRWQATGRVFPPYDSTFQTAVAGYPRGSIVESLVENLLFYISLVDSNVTNPDTGGAGWAIWSRQLRVNTDIYVNAATGNDSNNGLTPATAKRTIQAAVNTAWTFPPSSSFIITIHVADGTYAENVVTPSIPGPSVTILGNTGTPANVLVNGSAASQATIGVSGPNILTVNGLKVTAAGASSPGFGANGSGATMITLNTASGAVSDAVFLANGGGAMLISGAHTFSGNSASLFSTARGGTLNFGTSFNLTISVAIAVTNTASSGTGVIEVPASSRPTFVNPGNVTGNRYLATLNGVINTQGAGATYFPGTVAGSVTSGGQYA